MLLMDTVSIDKRRDSMRNWSNGPVEPISPTYRSLICLSHLRTSRAASGRQSGLSGVVPRSNFIFAALSSGAPLIMVQPRASAQLKHDECGRPLTDRCTVQALLFASPTKNSLGEAKYGN